MCGAANVLCIRKAYTFILSSMHEHAAQVARSRPSRVSWRRLVRLVAAALATVLAAALAAAPRGRQPLELEASGVHLHRGGSNKVLFVWRAEKP